MSLNALSFELRGCQTAGLILGHGSLGGRETLEFAVQRTAFDAQDCGSPTLIPHPCVAALVRCEFVPMLQVSFPLVHRSDHSQVCSV